MRATGDEVAFVYKAAAEIGELGDNTAVLRAAIRDDALLHLALADDAAEAMVLGHTRWASVGIISEANAHPLEPRGARRLAIVPTWSARSTATSTTTPTSRRSSTCRSRPRSPPTPRSSPRSSPGAWPTARPVDDAFRTTVAELEGSMAIAAQTAAAPDQLLLSLRGSGQALYVGLAEDAFVVASEPYGLVEETDTLPPHGRRDPGRPRARRRHPRPGRRCSTPRARARSRASGGPPTTARRCR